MSTLKPARGVAGMIARWWRRPRGPIPWTVAGLARQLDPAEAGVLLAYHQARTGEPGYVPAWFGIAAAERAVRRGGWERAEVIRSGRDELLALGLLEPTELETRRRRPR